MSPGISTFTNLPTPIKVGVLLVSGAGITTVLYTIFGGQLLWILPLGIAVVALLVFLYLRLLKLWRKRKAAPMERGVIANTSSTPEGISAAAHMARLDDLRKKFEDGVQKFHAAGKSLYNFPWYMIVGEPGSGKTEAIRHCNIGFPPGLQDQFQGAGGTLNMNWWFTDHAVILDTAGRLMFDEVDTGGSSEWKEFLKLLKKSRPRCPVNGVFLVIPADSLIKDTSDEIERKASKIARQFDVIQRTLDVRFPVFVVITKSDLLNGFRDFFDNLTDPQLQHQILGWSNPEPLDNPYNPDFVRRHLETIQGRLFRRRLALLQEVMSDEPGVEKTRAADTLYAFPQSLAKIAPRMARYLELIFSVGSQWSCKPLFFRGIYFTSSMREGSALDEDLAESIGVPVDSLPDGRVWERDRAYFLRDLFVKKVFREKGLVTHATNAKKLHSRRKAVVLISGIAAVVLVLFFTIFSAISYRRSIGDLEDYLVDLAGLVAPSRAGAKVGALRVLEPDVADRYKYFGPAGVGTSRIPSDVNRADVSARLADTVYQWESKGRRWIFKLAEKYARRITAEKLRRAQGAIYEIGVLEPFVDAACNIMVSRSEETWDPERDPNVLVQLVRLAAGKPLGEEELYSERTLLEPFFSYVGENRPPRADWGVLHEPLGRIYGDAWPWPPPSLRNDPNLQSAIETGVSCFIGRRGGGGLADIRRLEGVLRRFDDAEQGVLTFLEDACDLKVEELLIDERWEAFVGDWNSRYALLSEAFDSIGNEANALDEQGSLVKLWERRANEVRSDVNENYDLLLREMQDVNESPFLGGIRTTLEEARARQIQSLTEGDEDLERFDKDFWAGAGGRHLYAMRFEMYSRANDHLEEVAEIANIAEVRGAIDKVKVGARATAAEMAELLKVADGTFRFVEASKGCSVVIGFGEQRQIHRIVQRGLAVAPKSIAAIGEEVARRASWARPGVPAEIVASGKRYDPNGAAGVFEGWKLLGDALKTEPYNFPDKSSLSRIHADANPAYGRYLGSWVNYWLVNEAERLVSSKVEKDSKQLELLYTGIVFKELLKDVGEPLERALGRLEKHLPSDSTSATEFRTSLERTRERISREMYDKHNEVLGRWRQLSELPREAGRRTLLNVKPSDFIRSYTPFSYKSAAEFSEMYWTELTYSLLRMRGEEVQNDGKKTFAGLKSQYGHKFPLDWYGEEELTKEELQSGILPVLGQVLGGDYDEGTVGRDIPTGQATVDKLLDRLREIELSASDRRWLEGIERVVGVLPKGADSYYCNVYLLGQKEQTRLSRLRKEDLLYEDLRFMKFVQDGRDCCGAESTFSTNDVKIGELRYPGGAARIKFYAYLEGAEADKASYTTADSGGDWACLKILRDYSFGGEKGYIEIKVDKSKSKDGLGGVVFLRLELCEDGKCDRRVSLPSVAEWPSLKGRG
ncbi:MAG: hypothetical protein JSU94_09095 [Phycisphaerales bacterium]|nr:MAG: hypothetical protein JSU94_09095 [Phycisphaerales bacterium]